MAGTDFPTPTDPHLDAIIQRIPQWLREASPSAIRAYRTALQKNRQSSRRAQALMQTLPAPSAFARLRLEQALRQAVNRVIDVDQDLWIRFNRGSVLLGRPLSVTRTPLLEVAMANFGEAETQEGYWGTDTVLLQADALKLQIGGSGRRWTYGWHYELKHQLPLAPHQYAQLCRKLDLGGAYQARLQALLQGLGPDGTEAGKILRMNIRDELAVRAQEALLKGDIDEPAMRVIEMLLGDDDAAPQWHGVAPTLYTVSALNTWVQSGTPLHGVLCIECNAPAHPACLIYLAGDADQPFKLHASFSSFSDWLRNRLRDDHYRRDFTRFVGKTDQATFSKRLLDTLSPEPFTLGQPKDRVADPHADIGLRQVGLPTPEPLVTVLQNMLAEKLAADARYILVPTADIDQARRDERFKQWLEQGLTLLNVASVFVPALAPLVVAVGTAQLLGELFVGVDDWIHGQTEEAVGCFLDVAANVALVGATAAAGMALNASPFVKGMLPVVDAAGETRLWNVEPETFATPALPDTVKPNALGQYAHLGQNHIKLDGRFYRQNYDSRLKRWHVVHPDSAQPWRIALEHNDAGAWRMAHENLAAWTAQQAISRLGPLVDTLDAAQLHRLRRVCGLTGRQLRRLHLPGQRVPPRLIEAAAYLRAQRMLEALPSTQRVLALDRWQQEFGVWPAYHEAQAMHRDFPTLSVWAAEDIVAGANLRERTQLGQGRVPLRLALSARAHLWDMQLDRSILGLLGSVETPEVKRLRAGIQQRQGRKDISAVQAWRWALEHRSEAAEMIGQRRPKAINAPTTLADGRVGYRLSGRASGSAEPDPGTVALPTRAQREAQEVALLQRLDRWVDTPATVLAENGERVAVNPAHRATARQRILDAWNGQAPRIGVLPGQPIRYFLDLSELRIGALPVLNVALPQVCYLTLEGSGLERVEASFLDQFPRLEQLDLQNNHLTEIPPAVASLPNLQSLSMDNNRLVASASMFDALQGLDQLQALILRNNPMHIPGAAMERLSTLRSLRYLALSNTDHTAMAEHLPWVARLPELESLWLQGNALVLTPTAMQALADMSSLDYLDLSDNPLGSALDLSRLRSVGALNLRNCQLSTWPSGLTALMNQEPLWLRWVQLEENPISDVPELQSLRFFTTEPQIERPLSLTFTSLNPHAVARLNAVGITFDYLQILADGADAAAQSRLAQLRTDPSMTRMLQLLARLSETADYRLAPASLATRAWDVIDAAHGSLAIRAELAAVAERPENCGDQVILLFADLEQQLWYARAADPSLDGAQRQAELLATSRSLFRLDQLNRLARADVRARATARDVSEDEIEEVEVFLAYRVGLAERLELRHQPHAMLFDAVEPVSAAQLDAAATQVLAAETPEALLDWHMTQDYWLQYLRRQYPARLDAALSPFVARREALAAQAWDEAYDERLVALQVEEAAAQTEVLRELTQQAMNR